MITFATLLLGLVVGQQPIVLLTDDSVARVEIYLDDTLLASLAEAPWELTCDFGARLRMHELLAVAFDRHHREVGRSRQWINVPRRMAEANVLIDGEGGSGRVARLSWESVTGRDPSKVSASFDGSPLDATRPHNILLPDHDPNQLHFFRADLEFADNISSQAEIVFGGSYADELEIDLTAVALRIPAHRDIPAKRDLRGRFHQRGKPLEVVAIEKGPSELLLIRDDQAIGALGRIGRASRRSLARRARLGNQVLEGRNALRHSASVAKDVRIRFLWPHTETLKPDLEVFPPTPSFNSSEGGMYWFLTNVVSVEQLEGEKRLSDAVAVGGLLTAGRNRRRAIVLVVSPSTRDRDSRFRFDQAREFLASLRVPLVVWCVGKVTSDVRDQWGDAQDISSLDKLEKAVIRLEAELESQRIVWLSGTHLPRHITFQNGPEGFRLAG